MTRWFWEQTGGTLIEEFPAVRRTASCAGRWIDGVIVPDGPRVCIRAGDGAGRQNIDLRGRSVVAVQAKDSRLGMYLLGQVLFSARLLRSFGPSHIESVALCRAGDSVLEPLLSEWPEIRVIVCPAHIQVARPAAEPLSDDSRADPPNGGRADGFTRV